MKKKMLGLIIVLLCLCVYGYSRAKEIPTLPIEGRVVDYTAKPVEGAEVAVFEKIYRNKEESPKMIAPLVKTDPQGHFALKADRPSQYSTFIVAQKEGLALAWDGLNYSSNNKGKGNFLLVMEKACTVTGHVVDHSGKAVPGAEVHALPKTSYMSRLNQRPIIAPKEWFTTETDSQGSFQFDKFAADVSCDFWVKAPKLSSTYKFTTNYLSGCGFEVWRSDIRLVLPQEGDIKGRAVDAETGKSIGGVELIVRAEREREDILNQYCNRMIKTDANGTFECIGLPEGKNKIELAEPENETAQWILKPVEVNVAAGQASGNVELLLEKGELIECTVRENGSEQPLEGINVSVYGNSGSTRLSTDETGTVHLRIPPGEYQAYASGEGYTSWRVNEPVIVKAGEATHMDILLNKIPMLKGSVADANKQPAKNVSVTVHPFGDHVYTDQEGNFIACYEEQRAGNGVFVMARAPERSCAALFLMKELRKPVELTLGPALTVKGQITDLNGTGIPAARVSLCFHYTNCLSDMGTETLTDSSGYFTFDAIPPVNSDFDYRISVYAAGFGQKEYKRLKIEGKPGTTTEVQAVQLTPANVSISGIVVDANGLPAARVPVFLNDADGSDQPRKTTATDQDGKFELKRICKGPLRLQANFRSSPKGEGMLYAQGGDKDVKIILGQEGAHRPQVSLVGKNLPEPKDLGIKLSPVDIEGRKMLFCFWDMQQRPSRRCITQLAKQAEQLKSKGVTIIAVQASKIDREVLDQWIEKYNVPFQVGLISGDVEKARLEWGVKSLPWLILTDDKHIVRAEGFGLTELDDKIAPVD